MGLVTRLAWGAVALGAGAFAVQGGEYSTSDLRAQRARRAALAAEIDTLARVVDSLRALERRLRTDPGLQERVAREEFGMVRGDKELLYRFADRRPAAPDSAVRSAGAAPAPVAAAAGGG